MGDVAIVTNDITPSNNNSYIYNGTSWSTLSTYIQPSNISSLSDVHLTSITNNNILKYDSTSSKWINTSDSDTLSSLGDCSITTPLNNQSIIYDSTLTKWLNKQIDHTTLSNIGSNTHANIDLFIASKAQNSGLSSLNSIGKVPSTQLSLSLGSDSLADVHLAGLGNGNILVYNSSTGIWNNQPQHLVSTTLSTLTDCNISSILNNQCLI